jgi:uncharacterized protein YdeI (YjbR/CyaY-like superfamily)
MSPKKIGDTERALRQARERSVQKPRTQEITATEAERLKELETVIRTGLESFLRVGAALAEIKESRLYRATHPNFPEYCRDRWGMGKSRAYQLIDATAVVGTLRSSTETMPENERQARPLKALPEEQRGAAWDEAVERAQGQPTQEVVQDVVKDRMKPETSTMVEGLGQNVPDDEGPDMASELAHALEELDRARTLIEALKSDDVAQELATMHSRYTHLEARVGQLTETARQAQRQAEWQGKTLRSVREILNVDRDAEIVPAIRDLMR